MILREGVSVSECEREQLLRRYDERTALPLCRFAALPPTTRSAVVLLVRVPQHRRQSSTTTNHQQPPSPLSLPAAVWPSRSLARALHSHALSPIPSSVVAVVIERVHAMESELSVFTGADAAAFAGGPKTATLRLVVEWDAQRFTQTVSSLDAFDLQDLARRLKARFRS